jgi:hypothetical protein
MSNPISAVGNPGSQLERALLWYLQQCLAGAWSDGVFTLQDMAPVRSSKASEYSYYFSNDWKKRTLPLYEVLAYNSVENPTHSRNESYQVAFKSEWKGNNVAGAENPDTNWVSINNQVGMLMAAMSQMDDGSSYAATCRAITASGRQLATIGEVQDQTNNADMAQFTVKNLKYKGAKRAQIVEGTLTIMEVRNFEIDVCPENVD